MLSLINTAAQGVAAGQGATVSKIEVACSGDDGKITAIKVTATGGTVSPAEVCQLAFGTNTLPDAPQFGGTFKVGATWAPATADTAAKWTATDLDTLS